MASRRSTAPTRTGRPGSQPPAGSGRPSGPGSRRSPQPISGQEAPLWRRLLPVVAAFVVGVLVVAVIWAVASRPDETEQTIAELQTAEVQRDLEQTVALVELARETVDEVVPVLDELSAALPTEGEPATPASPEDVARWRTVLEAAAQRFDDPPSAGTQVNLARGGIATAVRQLGHTVTAYEAALAAPAGERPERLELAAGLRDEAVVSWSLGATQLDLAAIAADQGHAHVFLPATPGGPAFEPDPAPEGQPGS